MEPCVGLAGHILVQLVHSMLVSLFMNMDAVAGVVWVGSEKVLNVVLTDCLGDS